MNESAASARLQFRLRTLINCGIVLGVFIPAAMIFEALPGGWILDAALIGILFYVFFFVLENRAIGMKCPHCLKYIASNTPWICGFCQQINRRVDQFPFVHRCEHCQAEPKAYRCHHCGQPIFLTEDEQTDNFARSLAPPREDKTKEEISEQERERRNLEHQLLATRLNAELKEEEKRTNPPPKKGPREALEEHYSAHQAKTMSAHEIVRRERAANAEKYKDDPDMLERANASLDSWLNQVT